MDSYDWLKVASYKTATWLNQYASQSQPEKVTDEKIEQWACDHQFDDGLNDCVNILIYAAKALRDNKIK